VRASPEKVDAQRHHAAQLTARSNVFVERLWRSIKYEEVYLHAYDSVSQAKTGIACYINFYNTARPHSSLDKKTPDEFYFATLPAIEQAA
jgi:putative transposase